MIIKKVTVVAVGVIAALIMDFGTVGAAQARRRASKKATEAQVAAPQAPEKTKAAVESLMKPFQWGMTTAKVLSILEGQIRKEYEPKLKLAVDPLDQDKVRRELMDKIKELKESKVEFKKKQTPWDVSLVEKEFNHNNNEAMVVRWGHQDRRFYFFHHDRLWKVYIAFNAELYQGKTFEDFANAMEGRFGRAEQKYSPTIKGDSVMDHMEWPASGRTVLRAIDNTGFYGNFCLVLFDQQIYAAVQQGAKASGGGIGRRALSSDGLIDSVTKEPTNKPTDSDANEDVVDQLTGRRSKSPTIPKVTAADPSESPQPAPAAKKPAPKKKLSNNPLDNLDI